MPRKLSHCIRSSSMDSEVTANSVIHPEDRVFLYFHGNAGNRGTFSRVLFYKMLLATNCHSHIITADYRGFGDSTPLIPTEQGVKEDALAVYNYVKKNYQIDGKRMILVGHSLGTGIATYLAKHMSEAQDTPSGLILLAPYTSIPEAAVTYRNLPILFPLRLFPELLEWAKSRMTEVWASEKYIQDVKSPVLFVHGDNDMEIRPEFSSSLFKAVRAVHDPVDAVVEHLNHDLGDDGRLTVSPDHRHWHLELKHASHNDLHVYDMTFDTIHEFLSATSK